MGIRLRFAGYGLLSALAGLGVGHLVAGLLLPAASPVLVVGSAVIDLTPTPVKTWAIRTFGTADKPILIGSVALGVLLLSLLAGIVARRSFKGGATLLGLMAAVAAFAAWTRPAGGPLDAGPALVTGVVAIGALALLLRWEQAAVDEQTARERSSEEATGSTRRGVLLGSGAVLAVGAVAGASGQWLVRRAQQVRRVVLPRPADPAGPIPQGLEQRIDGISPLQTPISDFYRVDTALIVPNVNPDDWTLTIDGDVGEVVELTFDELVEMPMIERHITLSCVSNEVGGPYVGATKWLGVPLKDVLDRAGIEDTSADQILSTSVDGYTASTPLELALDGRDTMIAVAMDGRQLTGEHGFPARLLTPGLFGFVGATKWLERLTLTTYDAEQAYWTERGWATDAPVKVTSRIDTPQPLATLEPGEQVVAGVAWCQHRGIKEVQVRVDGGAWQPVKLGPEVNLDYWRQWYLPWQATEGQHRIAVRAITGDGEVQTPARAAPFPDGSSGIQEIVVNVG